MLHAFLGAMLAATSVGITARVLKDVDALQDAGGAHHPRRGRHRRRPGAAGAGRRLRHHPRRRHRRGPGGRAAIAFIVVKACVFLVGALVIGSFLSPRLFRAALALRIAGIVAGTVARLLLRPLLPRAGAGLAPIVGAFAAGLVLEEVHFEEQVRKRRAAAARDAAAPDRAAGAGLLRPDGDAGRRALVARRHVLGVRAPADRGRRRRQAGLRPRRSRRGCRA